MKLLPKKQSILILEEIVNSIFHGIGVIATIFGVIYFSLFLTTDKSLVRLIGFYFFLATSIIMYLTSTLYHGLSFTKARKVFLLLDYSAVFLFIAGTYTAYIAATMPTWIGLIFMVIIWVVVISSVTLRSIFHKKEYALFILVYLLLGWSAIVVMKFSWHMLSFNTITLLVGGGLSYTIGVIFFSLKKLPFTHAVWHLCVMAGTLFHYLALVSL